MAEEGQTVALTKDVSIANTLSGDTIVSNKNVVTPKELGKAIEANEFKNEADSTKESWTAFSKAKAKQPMKVTAKKKSVKFASDKAL